jgi:hypothetical protein
VAAFAAVQVAAQTGGFRWEELRQPYPPMAQALDELARERGLRNGLGGFWAARRLSYLGREGLRLHALGSWGEPWCHSSRPGSYLSDDPHDLALPRFDCVVRVDYGLGLEPSAEKLRAAYGPPAEVRPVPDGEVWLYERVRSPGLEEFLRAQLASRRRQTGGFLAPAWPDNLARPKANFTAWNARGNVVVPPGGAVTACFVGPVAGRTIDLSAGWDAAYFLTFCNGAEVVGTVLVPPVFWSGAAYGSPGLQSRLVKVPEAVRSRGWDRVVITPMGGEGKYGVGHLLVYDEDLP